MSISKIPLNVLSIGELFSRARVTFEVPIYQRNYAWGRDEIAALVQDVFDVMKVHDKDYYIGTLVTYDKGDGVYEVIDGQQRLTTVFFMLKALNVDDVNNRLTYRARKYADATIRVLPDCRGPEVDTSIVQGYRHVEGAIKEIVPPNMLQDFKACFLHHVKIVHYRVPKDVDLNHYFEIMNSRGEQLEKHEIVKARLLGQLDDNIDKSRFSTIWEACREMNVYIQQSFRNVNVFGKDFSELSVGSFNDMPVSPSDNDGKKQIKAMLEEMSDYGIGSVGDGENRGVDVFQPIIDFPNFLLVVLKVTRLLDKTDNQFNPAEFNLDDKELLNEFKKLSLSPKFVREFGYNLLKARFLLDNRIVHHACEDDTVDSNPWKLQCWKRNKNDGKCYPTNLAEKEYDDDRSDFMQGRMTQLLSMFEVSFTPHQRKNYLVYCLLYLFTNKWDAGEYCDFLNSLAKKYFLDIYMVSERLSEANVPKPGSFDDAILQGGELDVSIKNYDLDFKQIYGDGERTRSKGIPLFVFNYLDYCLWLKYAKELRGEETKVQSPKRREFFNALGCGDIDLSNFKKFYFSRTRRSLEHYFPKANADGKDGHPDETQINCLGNYAMIGSEMNSSGSYWEPQTKVHHYLDDHSGKVRHVSVSSLKFLIMLQLCKDKGQWTADEIQTHQRSMLNILFAKKDDEKKSE